MSGKRGTKFSKFRSLPISPKTSYLNAPVSVGIPNHLNENSV